jgi:hypothetical protein
MGTSSIFRGNNDRNSLLPLDYSEQLGTVESPVTWKTAKTSMSKYISSGGSHGSAGHIVRQAIKANGGAHRMALSALPSIRAARSLGGFFASVRSNGVYTTLHQLGIQYEGRNVKDIFSHLINAISPDATTKEDIVARQAAQEALINVYEYVTNNDMDLSCIDNMPVEVMDKAMKSFLTEYIWATAMKDLESRVEQYMLDVSSACEREKELKDTIEAVIDIEYDNHGSIIQNDVNEAILALTERCLSVLEGIV